MSVGAAPSFVGRDREVESLRTAIGDAAGGRGRVVFVEGEPGIGKTRLVALACAEAAVAGFDVYQGACDDLVGSRPFAPLVTAFGVGAAASDPGLAALAELMGREEEPGPLVDVGAPNPGLQHRIVDAFSDLVERLALRRPLLLAVDDLQWADVSTLVVLRSVARRTATLPVLLLGSARTGHGFADLHRVTDDMIRAGAVRLGLGPLDDESVAALVAEVVRASPSEALLSRVRGATGNPLFVIEYARSVEASGAAGGDAAQEFRSTVLRRLGPLPQATNDALRLGAVLGSSFAAADLVAVSGRSMVELAPALHDAVVAGLLEDSGERVAFRHALVRDAIYEHIPAAVRAELHREAGRALATAGSDALVVAHHLGLAATRGDREAVDWLRRAARDAAPRSPATAVELLRRAHGLLGPSASVPGTSSARTYGALSMSPNVTVWKACAALP